MFEQFDEGGCTLCGKENNKRDRFTFKFPTIRGSTYALADAPEPQSSRSFASSSSNNVEAAVPNRFKPEMGKEGWGTLLVLSLWDLSSGLEPFLAYLGQY